MKEISRDIDRVEVCGRKISKAVYNEIGRLRTEIDELENNGLTETKKELEAKRDAIYRFPDSPIFQEIFIKKRLEQSLEGIAEDVLKRYENADSEEQDRIREWLHERDGNNSLSGFRSFGKRK